MSRYERCPPAFASAGPPPALEARPGPVVRPTEALPASCSSKSTSTPPARPPVSGLDSAQFLAAGRGLRTLGAWQRWGPVLQSCVGCEAADGARFPGLRTPLRVFLCDVPVVSAWRPGSGLFGFPASLGPRARAHCRGIAVVSSDIVLRRACRSECDPCVPWCACVCWSWCRGPSEEALKQNSTVKTTVSWALFSLWTRPSALLSRLVGPSVGPAGGLQGRSEGRRRRLPSYP